MANKIKNKSISIVLFCIVTLGFCLRLYHLSRPSLWLDEIITVCTIKGSLLETVRNLFVSPNPPLYYVLMNLWVKFFGTSEFALRSPSLIFSFLSIIFIFKLTKELFNEKVGIVSALLLSIWPYSINYAQEARMYALLWLLGILSFLFFYRFSRDNKISDLFSYIIFTVLSVYTSYTGWIFIIIQNILFFSFFNAKQSKRWLLAQLIIILLYLPWIDKLLYNLIQKTGVSWIPKTNNYFRYFVNLFLLITGISKCQFGAQTSLLKRIELGLYLFLIISTVIYFKNIRQKRHIFDFTQNDALIFAWAIVPIVVYLLFDALVFPILIARYMGFIHIPLIILFSKGLDKYNFKIKSAILALMLCIIFSAHLLPYYEHNLKISYQDWRELSLQLHKRISPNALIITNLPKCIIEYYSQDRNIEIISQSFYAIREKKDVGNQYDSIFIIYVFSNENRPVIKELKGYRLKEYNTIGSLGFSWFKKI